MSLRFMKYFIIKYIENMKTKEICIEIDNLERRISNWRKKINTGVYNYLKSNVGIASANSESSKDRIGKVVAEEFCWYWSNTENLIIITYCVFRNQWGDFSDEKETKVDPSVIDQYI